jgi:hypothetical protein
MGQQQILLIVLGVIIVGVAIVVGINVFSANAVSSNRDGVVSDLNNLGTVAQQYYRKPTAMGGGGYSFTGWTVPPELDTTANGTFSATVNAQTVTIVGNGFEKFNGNPVQHTATITQSSTTIVQNN